MPTRRFSASAVIPDAVFAADLVQLFDGLVYGRVAAVHRVIGLPQFQINADDFYSSSGALAGLTVIVRHASQFGSASGCSDLQRSLAVVIQSFGLAVDFLFADRDRDAVLLCIIDGTLSVAQLKLRIFPRRDNLRVRLPGNIICQLVAPDRLPPVKP